MSDADWRRTALLVLGTAATTAIVTKFIDRLWGAKAQRPDDRDTDELRRTVEKEVLRQVVGHSTLDFAIPGVRHDYPPVASPVKQKRILVTGGAGFVGSHLVDVLMTQGHVVYVLDNLFTGHRKNITHWEGHPNFTFFQRDVVQPFFVEVDQIYHLACPASPPHYQKNPIKTIKCSTMGTMNMLGLAKRCKARLLFSSTSEIYGDPEVHPQTEAYWGHVNTLGPRACYDEGKRVAETMCCSYRNEGHVDIRIARIFNTFGPRMDLDDGRVVSNFIIQALRGENITVYGEGQQTRSFMFVSDLIRGLVSLMESDYDQPVNIGNPVERTILDFARFIARTVGTGAEVVHLDAIVDDPRQRQPDISRARDVLGWEPDVLMEDGLVETVNYFEEALGLATPQSHGRASPVWLKLPLDIPGVSDGGHAGNTPRGVVWHPPEVVESLREKEGSRWRPRAGSRRNGQ